MSAASAPMGSKTAVHIVGSLFLQAVGGGNGRGMAAGLAGLTHLSRLAERPDSALCTRLKKITRMYFISRKTTDSSHRTMYLCYHLSQIIKRACISPAEYHYIAILRFFSFTVLVVINPLISFLLLLGIILLLLMDLYGFLYGFFNPKIVFNGIFNLKSNQNFLKFLQN